jgi:hypothetical protein
VVAAQAIPDVLTQAMFLQIRQIGQQNALALIHIQPFEAQAAAFWNIIVSMANFNALQRLQGFCTIMAYLRNRPMNVIWDMMRALPVNQVVEESDDEDESDEGESEE